MPTPDERTRALLHTKLFLDELLDRKVTPRVPAAVRRHALGLLRHYPHAFAIELANMALPNVFGPVPFFRRMTGASPTVTTVDASTQMTIDKGVAPTPGPDVEAEPNQVRLQVHLERIDPMPAYLRNGRLGLAITLLADSERTLLSLHGRLSAAFEAGYLATLVLLDVAPGACEHPNSEILRAALGSLSGGMSAEGYEHAVFFLEHRYDPEQIQSSTWRHSRCGPLQHKSGHRQPGQVAFACRPLRASGWRRFEQAQRANQVARRWRWNKARIRAYT